MNLSPMMSPRTKSNASSRPGLSGTVLAFHQLQKMRSSFVNICFISFFFAFALTLSTSATQLPQNWNSEFPKGPEKRTMMSALGRCAALFRAVIGMNSRQVSLEPDPGARRMRQIQRLIQNPNFVSKLGKKLGLEIRVYNQTPNADQPTGDFYRVEELPNGKLAVFVGDVEGKGPFAGALSMILLLEVIQISYTIKPNGNSCRTI